MAYPVEMNPPCLLFLSCDTRSNCTKKSIKKCEQGSSPGKCLDDHVNKAFGNGKEVNGSM